MGADRTGDTGHTRNLLRRLGTAVATLSVAGAGALAVPGAAAAATGPTPFAVGISPGATIDYLSAADLDRTVAGISRAGGTWIRLDVFWPAVEPAQGKFDWSLPDRVFSAAHGAGLNVLAILDYTPDWAKLASGFPDPAAFASFSAAATSRYAPEGVHAWEIWNEENLASTWGPRVDPAAYTTILRAGAAAIRGVDPGATILTGGLAPASDAADGSEMSPASFLSGIYAAGGQASFDAVADHPYSYPDLPATPDSWNAFHQMPALHQIMATKGDGAKQIWATEYGAPTGTASRSVSGAVQAQMLTQAVTTDRAYPWAGPLFWYGWQDAGSDTGNIENDFGVYTAAWQPKPSLDAFTAAAASVGAGASAPAAPVAAPSDPGPVLPVTAPPAAPVGAAPAPPVSAGPTAPSGTASVPAVGPLATNVVGIAAPPSAGGADSRTRAASVVLDPAPAGASPTGYWLAGSNGAVAAEGVPALGPASSVRPIVGMAATPDGNGYWLVASDGGVFSSGDAAFRGSTGAIRLSKPIVGMAATPDGNGYWLVASDGGVFTFGDAAFLGSAGSIRLRAPIVGMAATPDGNGYWLVASDGGVFTYGDAGYAGSAGSIRLQRPIVGMGAMPDGRGYWLVASDGGVFTYGDASYHGSTGALRLARPIVGMAVSPDGNGYWLAAADGGVFSFGDAPFRGAGTQTAG